MKAVVMEINKRKMIVMTNEGLFKKVEYVDGAILGEEVNITEGLKGWTGVYKYTALAASITLILLAGIQTKLYYTPYGYMNIDINPSVQLEFNRYERILNARALNEDGTKIIEHVGKIKNKKLDSAAKLLVEASVNDDYIKDNVENDIMLTLYSQNRIQDDVLKNKVNLSVENILKLKNKKAELINEIATKEEVDRAELQKISVGKLKLYEKIKQVKPEITIEEVKTQPVRELVKIIKEAKNEKKEQTKDEKTNENKKDSEDTNVSIPNAPEKRNAIKDEPKVNRPQSIKPEDAVIREPNEAKKLETEKKIDIINKEIDKIKKPQIPKVKSHEETNKNIEKLQDRIKEIEKVKEIKNKS